MRKTPWLPVLAALVLWPLAGSAGAADFLNATGVEVMTGIAYPGEVRCPGGEPTGLPFPMCSEGSNQVNLRGLVETATYVDLAGEAAWMFDGTNTITIHCNLDAATYQGHCWGTCSWDLGAAGSWRCTWSGQLSLLGAGSHIQGIGHGSGEQLEGYQFFYEAIDGAFTARVMPPAKD